MHSVLIVEDDSIIRETLQQVLELEGFRVSTAPNGREGLEKLGFPYAGRMPEHSLVLLDLMMPVMNGWEFMTELHRRAGATGEPAPPVIVITAAGERANLGELRAATIVPKPIDLDRLLGAIARHLPPNGQANVTT